MKRTHLFIVILVLAGTILTAYFPFNKINFSNARNNNVCKALKGDVLLYIVFVDSKTTSPWTEFDIQTTMDSIKITVSWLEAKAREQGINLNIKTDFYVGDNFSTVKRDLPEGTVRQSVTYPNLQKGVENMNKWADNVSRKAGESFDVPNKDGIPEIKNPRNKERLVAFLRDQHKVESIGVLFFVNNYYRDDISVTLNTLNSNDIEYSVISYKYPAVIAHNILHLFGAADLHETPFRKSDKAINYALQEFPDDIMLNPYAKPLSTRSIGAFTSYLINWCDTLNPKHEFLLEEKGIKL